MPRVMVINVVGLTRALLGPHTPNLNAIAAAGFGATMGTVLPAVTCSAQATMLTGSLPRDHGIVGNGWYFRDLGEVLLWRQSHALLGGVPVWETARQREPGSTCAQMFWWYNMGVSCEWSATPRPVYWADGRKSPDFYARPPGLKGEIEAELGPFPLFSFWGPGAGIASSRWIARAAAHVHARHGPTLSLVYLPHLDYDLQRKGPRHPGIQEQVRAVDALVGDLHACVAASGGEVIVVSEYGISEVSAGVHINRRLREAGLLEVVTNPAGELLDPLVSRAFAVADHQIAHVYVRDPADLPEVRSVLSSLDGVETVLDDAGKAAHGLDHARSGELVAIAARDRWFTYYYWQDDRLAPDFARCVEIHRKPGYDPVELFLDPRLAAGGKPAIAWRLAKKLLGFRTTMNVIPFDDTLVRGSHGRLPDDPAEGPVFLSTASVDPAEHVDMPSVKSRILATLAR